MLDEKTLKVLEFLNEHPDKWFSLEELCENGVPADWETLKWMQEREMVRKQESDDPVGRALGERTYIYRFGAAGRVTLEEHISPLFRVLHQSIPKVGTLVFFASCLNIRRILQERRKSGRTATEKEKSPYWLQICNSKGRGETVY